MSAFAALHLLDGRPAAAEQVGSMLDAMPHRCRDGRGQDASGSLALGHGLLATAPEALRERQPLRAGDILLAADVRLDNRAELLPALGLSPDVGDAQLLVAAYGAWGDAMLDRLVGDFAFALWDGPRRRLLCARDQIGVRPFYYTHQPGRLFAAATEPKALLALPEVDPALDEARIADYLTLAADDGVRTSFRSIRRLPPAHRLIVEEGSVRIERYFNLEPDPSAHALTDEEAIARFQELFREAVAARLRSAVPVGAHLSGGLDSSAITCMARDVLRQRGEEPLHTFTLAFPGDPHADEMPFVRKVLDGGDLVPHIVDGTQVGPLANLAEVSDIIDDGVPGGMQHLVWALFRRAADEHVGVVLDGIDGDQVVGHGLLRLKELAAADAWATFAREVRALTTRFGQVSQRQDFEDALVDPRAVVTRYGLPVLRERAESGRPVALARGIRGLSAHFGMSRKALWKLYYKKLLLPPFLRRLRRGRRTPPAPETPILADAFVRQTGYLGQERSDDAEFSFDDVRAIQRQLLSSPRLWIALEMTDHYAAAHGVEVRHPFLDRRLIAFCLALPPHLSLTDGWTRYILRRAIEDVAPHEVAWRVGKAVMAPGFARALFTLDADRLDALLADIGPLARLVDLEALRELRRRGAELSEQEQIVLMHAAAMAVWMRRQAETRPAATGLPGNPRTTERAFGA